MSITIYNIIYFCTYQLNNHDTTVLNTEFMFWTISTILLTFVQLVIIYIFWGLSHDDWIEFEEKDT